MSYLRNLLYNPACIHFYFVSDMAERLSSLAHAHMQSLSQTTMQQPGPSVSSFNPRSVSFDIRSPEELAAVNEFLITLGRDVTGPGSGQRAGMHGPSDYQASPQSYFDPEGLAQLGIAGMPGVPSAPGSGAGYHGDAGYGSTHGLINHLPQAYPSRPSHPSLQSVQYGSGGLYPSLPDLDFPSAGPSSYQHQTARRVSLSPLSDDFPSRVNFHQPTPTHFLTPPYDPSTGGASPMSSHSSMSTPPNATPPHLSEGLHSFDYMRPSRGPPPAVQLAPVDFHTRTMRTIVPLRNAGGRDGPPEPVEPKWDSNGPRRGPLKLTSQYSTSSVSSQATASSSGSRSRSSSPASLRKSDSLYSHLLRDGDVKLAPINKKFRSSSPTDSPVSRESTLSPPPRHRASSQDGDEDEEDSDAAKRRSHSSTPSPPPTLPPIRSLAPATRSLSLTHYTEERLARGVGRIALDGRARVAPPLSPEADRKSVV